MQRALRMVPVVLFLLGISGTGAADVSGRWRGRLPIGEPPIEIVLVLPAGAGATGSARSPSHPDLEIALIDLEIGEEGVRFRLTGLPEEVSFEGSLAGDGARLEGRISHSPPRAPDTDIHLLEVETKSTPWKVLSARNVTDRDGYDNQPYFLPRGEAFLYTSIRDGQADIHRYDVKAGSSTQLTDTPETSEYSPTPLPRGKGFSTVRVEEDGTQRLWAFDRSGRRPRLLLEQVQPVGYHAWLDAGSVALFVLGTPPTLQMAPLAGGGARTLAEDIGRSLHRSPGGAITYVHKAAEDDWRIVQHDPATDRRTVVAAAVPDSEDFTFLPDGRMLTGDGSVLLTFEPRDGRWVAVADLEDHGIAGITRLAAHRRGRLLAVVGERPAGPAPEPATEPVTFLRVEP